MKSYMVHFGHDYWSRSIALVFCCYNWMQNFWRPRWSCLLLQCLNNKQKNSMFSFLKFSKPWTVCIAILDAFFILQLVTWSTIPRVIMYYFYIKVNLHTDSHMTNCTYDYWHLMILYYSIPIHSWPWDIVYLKT